MSTFYETHDNGGRPFKVEIREDNTVCLQMRWEDDFDAPQRIFIGKSPVNNMTKFSGGHGPDFDGNSILLQMKRKPYDLPNEFMYIYIGESVSSFKTTSPIVEYVSPVGNNDVPYPYAIDQEGMYYLITEGVIIEQVPKKYEKDPYEYYYRNKNLTADKACIPPKQPAVDLGYKKFYIDNQTYTLTYTPFPNNNYRRLSLMGKDDKGAGKLYLKMKDCEKKHFLSEKKYVQIMKKYGKRLGFKPLVFETLVARRF